MIARKRMRRGHARPSDLRRALDELGVMTGDDFVIFAAKELDVKVHPAQEQIEPQAHARNSDPDTSHQAAGSVENIRESQMAVLAVLQRLGPMTDERLAEVYDGPPQSPSGLRTRRAELAGEYEPPLVVDTGERVRLESGRAAIVWAATADAGNLQEVWDYT